MLAQRHESMLIMQEELVFPEPWWDLRGSGFTEAEQRDAIQMELEREVAVGHALYGRVFSVVARYQATDDVLIALDDETCAVVHLTWRRSHEVPPWPRTTIFDSLVAAIESMPAD
jgi:hypothetical protein